MSQLDISFGKKLRDAGIKQAIDHADAYSANWSQEAYEKLLLFLETHKEPFLAEEFRQFAENNGLESPPSARAYGAIMTRGLREEKIRKTGHGTVSNPKAHACFATVWIKF